jgi:hypothetical protein
MSDFAANVHLTVELLGLVGLAENIEIGNVDIRNVSLLFQVKMTPFNPCKNPTRVARLSYSRRVCT